MYRLLWIVASVILVTYTTFVIFGSILVDADSKIQNVIAVDRVKKSEHHVSGMLMLPSPCHGLSVHTSQLSSAHIHFTFESWQEPYRDCSRTETLRPFHVVTFAPPVGTEFTATLDGRPLRLHVIELYPI